MTDPRRRDATIIVLLGTIAAGAAPIAARGQEAEGPAPVRELVLDALKTFPIPRTGQAPNVQFVDTSLLPRDKTPRLEYEDQAADFTLGEAIRGEGSRAAATIVGDLDQGTTGVLNLNGIRGTFQDGETVRDAKGGEAKVRGALKAGIWVLDFAYKPLRVQTVEIPGKGRRQVYYLYYRLVNRTGKDRAFVPQFTLVAAETGKAYQDVVLPNAVQVIKLIELREDPQYQLLGAVDVVGMVRPSVKEGVDDAVFGVAIWEADDELARADRLNVFVRGLSDGYKRVSTPGREEGRVRYKALRIDFNRPGDERGVNSREFLVPDPPYEWIYY